MPKDINSNGPAQTCKVCAYAMQTESSHTLFRCGYSYFAKYASERVQERMDHYPCVEQEHFCGRWRDKLSPLLASPAEHK